MRVLKVHRRIPGREPLWGYPQGVRLPDAIGPFFLGRFHMPGRKSWPRKSKLELLHRLGERATGIKHLAEELCTRYWCSGVQALWRAI